VVQDGIDVTEDVPLGDGWVAVMGAELFERLVGDVFTTVGAVFGLGVEGTAECAALSANDIVFRKGKFTTQKT
jgi:hypothetical protein